jgi:hypothetical protein
MFKVRRSTHLLRRVNWKVYLLIVLRRLERILWEDDWRMRFRIRRSLNRSIRIAMRLRSLKKVFLNWLIWRKGRLNLQISLREINATCLICLSTMRRHCWRYMRLCSLIELPIWLLFKIIMLEMLLKEWAIYRFIQILEELLTELIILHL